MARKKLPLNRLKKKAWRIFSEWIRRRSADENGNIKCTTCPRIYPITHMQAGHFIHGHVKMTFFDERNVWPQCVYCNLRLGGNPVEYVKFMREKYGDGIIETLRELSHQIYKPTREDLEDIIQRYTLKEAA